MIMIDTNVVVDLIEHLDPWFDWSAKAFGDARLDGAVVASAVVAGELAGHASDAAGMIALLRRFGIECAALAPDACHRAGLAQLAYRAAGGKREKLLGDSLVGAHAESLGATLITRDPRSYRTYFPNLTLITPETDND